MRFITFILSYKLWLLINSLVLWISCFFVGRKKDATEHVLSELQNCSLLLNRAVGSDAYFINTSGRLKVFKDFDMLKHCLTILYKAEKKVHILTTTWQSKKNYVLCVHMCKLRHGLKISYYSQCLRITALGNTAGAQRRETSNTTNLNFTASIALDNRPAEPWPLLKANTLTLALQYVQSMPMPSFRKKI